MDLTGTLNEFLTWWSQQMLDLVPDRLRRRGQMASALIAVTHSFSPEAPAIVQLILRRRRRNSDLGSFTLDATGIPAIQALLSRRTPPRVVVLRLCPDVMLEREVVLPLAAERDLQQVLDYAMDRNTPFASSEVFWTWVNERRDLSRGRLHVRLFVVPKSGLQPVLAGLERAGVAATLLEATLRFGAPRLIDLRHATPARERWLWRGVTAAGIACSLLAVTASVLPFVLQSAERSAIEQRLAQIGPRIAQVEALRRDIAATAAGTDVFAAERARVGNTLEVLAAVTELLPDDTFLAQLTLHGGKLEMDGQSGAAARLITALSADPVIRNPAFAAAVTRQANGTDEFSIRAEVAP